MVNDNLKEALKSIIYNVVLDEEDAEDLVANIEQALKDFASTHKRLLVVENKDEWYLVETPLNGDPDAGTVRGVFTDGELVRTIVKALEV